MRWLLVLIAIAGCHDKPKTNSDPTINVVVFEVSEGGEPERFTGTGPTQSDASISIAWREVVAEHGIVPGNVHALFTEWEPSAGDNAFVHQTFPVGVRVSFSFSRPTDGNWEKALREAQRTIEETP